MSDLNPILAIAYRDMVKFLRDRGRLVNDTVVATVMASWSSAEKGGVASSLQVESKVYNAQFNEAPPLVHTFTAAATPDVTQTELDSCGREARRGLFSGDGPPESRREQGTPG